MEREIIQHLERFVSFRTVEEANEAKRECLEWIEATFLQPSGAKTSLMKGAVEDCPYLLLPHPEPRLLWFAHIDVVPGDDDQFSLTREGDRLIGRGAVDMKGNQLPFLLAYRKACEEGRNPPVGILLTSDEETAGPTIPSLIREGKLGAAPCAFTPDTTDRIVVEHKGVVWGELACRGTVAHAAYPWDGKNPIHPLAESLENIRLAFPQGTKDDWRMTVTPTMLMGGMARNQIPHLASCSIDIRFPPQDRAKPEEALEAVRKHLAEGCTIDVVRMADPLGTDPNSPMVQLVKRLAEEVTGEEVRFEREHGGTDARYFGNSGIPAFLYGPRGGGMHGRDEWVSLKSLCEQYEIMRRLIEELGT